MLCFDKNCSQRLVYPNHKFHVEMGVSFVMVFSFYVLGVFGPIFTLSFFKLFIPKLFDFQNCLAKRFDEKTNTVSLNKLMDDPSEFVLWRMLHHDDH